MKAQVLGNVILDKLPASNSAITFTYGSQGSGVSKNEYYVNLERVNYLYR